jgi:hypothetical protein
VETAQKLKVFCFFFSKKKFFLPSPFSSQQIDRNALTLLPGKL